MFRNSPFIYIYMYMYINGRTLITVLTWQIYSQIVFSSFCHWHFSKTNPLAFELFILQNDTTIMSSYFISPQLHSQPNLLFVFNFLENLLVFTFIYSEQFENQVAVLLPRCRRILGFAGILKPVKSLHTAYRHQQI